MGRDNSVGWASDWKARRNADEGSIPRRGMGFFSHGNADEGSIPRHGRRFLSHGNADEGSIPRRGKGFLSHGNADGGSIPRRGKGFFSQSALSVFSYGICTPPPPRAQSHASTCVRKLKNPKQHQPGHGKILHTLARMDSAVPTAAVALPREGDLNFKQGINEALNISTCFILTVYTSYLPLSPSDVVCYTSVFLIRASWTAEVYSPTIHSYLSAHSALENA